MSNRRIHATGNTLQNIIGREQLLFKEGDTFRVMRVSALFDTQVNKWIYWPSDPATHNIYLLVNPQDPIGGAEDIFLYAESIRPSIKIDLKNIIDTINSAPDSEFELEMHRHCSMCHRLTLWKIINGRWDCVTCPKFLT